MPEAEAEAINIDPIEEALADQYVTWGEHVADLTKSIEDEEAHLKRLRSSREDKQAKIAAVKTHLDDNFEGWDIRLAERSGQERPKKKQR